MSKDTPPLIVVKRLGALRAVSEAAEQAFAALAEGAEAEIAIKKTKPNHKRLALYWVVARKAAENWPMRHGVMTSKLLHRRTKEELNIGERVVTATGETIFDADSIGFDSMTEDQRAAFIDAAFALWAYRLEVDVETLVAEAKAA